MNAAFHLIKNKLKYQEIRFKNSFIAKLDGQQCATSPELYLELKGLFELPDYFGKNLDALYDSLMDLEWITKDHIILVIEHFDQLLSREQNDPELLEDFLITLEDVCKSWELLERDEFTPKSMRIYIYASDKVKELLENNEIDFEFI